MLYIGGIFILKCFCMAACELIATGLDRVYAYQAYMTVPETLQT